MPQPTVSKHLRVLRDAGFVESTVDAQRRLYRLTPEPLQEVDAWLAPFRRFWSAHLDALERHLDRMARTSPGSQTKRSDSDKREETMTDRDAVHAGSGQRGAGPKGRREVDAHSRQRTAPLTGKVWQALTDPAASARVGALRRRPEPGFGGNDREAHHRGRADAAGVRNHGDACRRTARARVQWGGNDIRWQLEAVGDGTRLTLWHDIDRRFISMGAAGWHICLDVLERHLAGQPIGRMVGVEVMKFDGWQRLTAEYARQFAVEASGGSPDDATR